MNTQADDVLTPTDDRKLANNYTMVKMLASAIAQGEGHIRTVPSMMCRVIDGECWRRWKDPHTGAEGGWAPNQFRAFVETPWPDGLGKTIDQAALMFAKDTKEWVKFHEMVRGTQGGIGNPSGRNQHSEVKCDEITLDLTPPVTIPIGPQVHQKPPTGTSTNYVIRRLGKLRPDLLDRVKVGELTPHGAAVIAGFVAKAITIPAEPVAAARRLVRHFTPDQFNVLVATALDLYGVPRGENP